MNKVMREGKKIGRETQKEIANKKFASLRPSQRLATPTPGQFAPIPTARTRASFAYPEYSFARLLHCPFLGRRLSAMCVSTVPRVLR